MTSVERRPPVNRPAEVVVVDNGVTVPAFFASGRPLTELLVTSCWRCEEGLFLSRDGLEECRRVLGTRLIRFECPSCGGVRRSAGHAPGHAGMEVR